MPEKGAGLRFVPDSAPCIEREVTLIEPDQEKFGAWVRAERTRLRIPVLLFAETLGISQPMLTKLELGTSGWTQENAQSAIRLIRFGRFVQTREIDQSA